MAINMVLKEADTLELYTNLSHLAGAPFVVGQIPAVALYAEDATSKKTVGRLTGIFDLSVKGINQAGNSAVIAGDQLYFTVGDTPKINKKNTGVPFGYALEGVDSAGTATINVLLIRQ